MEDILVNPVYNALLTGDKHLANGEGSVRYFDPEVSPFVGFDPGYENGFADLHDQLPTGRKILYAIPSRIQQPKGWKLVIEIEGLQFVHTKSTSPVKTSATIIPLDHTHAPEMVTLAALTKPGPFDMRTIEFGYYHGIFENGKLASMTGQRLHPGDYSEISAVCTHPDHLGKGYAAALLHHQLEIIKEQGKKSFLHVRADNVRAIEVYKRLGFEVSRRMNFYFMKRE